MLNNATIIGRTHRLMQQNCHDFSSSSTPTPGYAFGLVLDGCGSKYRESNAIDKRDRVTSSHNEVGAKLLGQFAAHLLSDQLSALSLQPEPRLNSLPGIIDNLYQECHHFLTGLLDLLGFTDRLDQARFIASHLLCTLVGFVVTPETAVFFWSGDGYLCHGEEIQTLDSQNRPEYLAYRLLPEVQEANADLHCFQTKYIKDVNALKWLAVATDGWNRELLLNLVTPRSDLTLQRWLNTQARRRNQFEDDGAVAVWHREEKVKGQVTDPESRIIISQDPGMDVK